MGCAQGQGFQLAVGGGAFRPLWGDRGIAGEGPGHGQGEGFPVLPRCPDHQGDSADHPIRIWSAVDVSTPHRGALEGRQARGVAHPGGELGVDGGKGPGSEAGRQGPRRWGAARWSAFA